MIPTNPQTASQTAYRANMTTVSKGWSALTEDQRNAWNTAAASGNWTLTNRLGEQFNPSGEQLYVQLNLNLLLAGQSTISDVPAKATFPTLTMGALTSNGTTPALTIAYGGTLGAGNTIVVSATPNLSAGVMSPQDSSFRVVTTSAGASPIDILSAFTAKFGSVVTGQKIFVKLEIVNDTSGEKIAVGSTSAVAA